MSIQGWMDGRLEVSRREHAESPGGPAAPRRVQKRGDIDPFGGCGASEGFGELASCTRELHTSIGSSGRLHSPRDAPVASTRRMSAGVVTSRVRLASSVPTRHSASSPKAGSADPDTSSLSTGSEPGRVRTARDEASSASPRAPRTDTWTGRRGVSRRVQQCERCRATRAHANGPHGVAEPLRYAAGRMGDARFFNVRAYSHLIFSLARCYETNARRRCSTRHRILPRACVPECPRAEPDEL